MMASKGSIHRLLVICLSLLLVSCGGPLLRVENPMVKASAEVTVTEAPATTPAAANPEAAQPEGDQDQDRSRREDTIRITILLDNYPYQPGLETAWGFSALISFGEENLLFDTGADGNMLLRNMADLDISPSQVQNVVLSHEHGDHTGGMQSLVRAGGNPTTYIPASFSAEFKNYYKNKVEVIEVAPGMQIMDRVYSLGEMAGPPPEQAVVIDTPQGLVVITGCAHPGIAEIVLKAKQEFKEEIFLVLGGFHLGNASASEVEAIIREFKRIQVQTVAPCHCTGDQPIGMFRNAFGDDFIQVGVGKVIEISNEEQPVD